VTTRRSARCARHVRPETVVGDDRCARVSASLANSAHVLIDARARERYRGDVEPLDPVAGHIPGALNRPYSENLDAGGRFKSADALAADFDALARRPRAAGCRPLLRAPASPACHNLLAMTHARRYGSRLYPGSWSEWCADPQRPVARGN
jgi:thiosulfate/3-mercaptopyruvate sulfurtransferase